MLLDVVTFSWRITSNKLKQRSVANEDKVIYNAMHLITLCQKVQRKNSEFIVKLALMDKSNMNIFYHMPIGVMIQSVCKQRGREVKFTRT